MIFLHLIPFILSLPFYVVFITNDNFRYQYYASYYWIIYLFAFFSVVGYCTWSVLLWSERIGTRSYALLQREGLAMILFLLACSTLLVTSSKIWRGSFYVDMQEIAHTFFYLITLFLAWELSVRVWVNRGVLSYRGAYHSAKIYPSVESTEEDKPDNDGFTSEQKHEYKRSVELFIQKKGFADPKLNRDKFIEKTKIPSRHLGSFLHNTYGKGFSAFINKLRVDYAAEELGKSDFEGTIDDLGLACGFRSRASFYRNFTAEFGCSPLEYRTNNLVMG
ncbi:helix-turn-helix domain-containing protein [Parapedobacter sp. SGR-10]|uniref:helix-turn-helix domain-containing protein n=1 Tax=Parapedobacter sp. SGR-10 TaxID=2710879 RepID=UPI0013D61FBB|nr:helix-turn-helix domain-containing protein [Parapedobacter sp. SGR-10]NGF54930.1 helix-turn-helix domain-containing protein [Parapedobacter sp. SGR-10]